MDPSETLDLIPSTTRLRDLVLGVDDAVLTAPTACADTSVADLCDHIGGLALAFTAAARHERLEHAAPRTDGSQLEPGWRQRVADQLDALGLAWTDPAAYEGMTQAGPIDLPAPVAARVALNEVVVHGWDLALGLGAAYAPDPAAVDVCLEFVAGFEPPADGPAAEGALYGPRVPVADDAPAMDRLLGLTGRDPALVL